MNELTSKCPQVISWTSDGESFVIWDKSEFESTYLSQYKFSTNFASFQRQLTNYGFSKDDNEYRHIDINFHRDHPERLKQVVYRSRTNPHSTKKRNRGTSAVLAADSEKGADGGDSGGNIPTAEMRRLHGRIDVIEEVIGEMRNDLKKVLNALVGKPTPPLARSVEAGGGGHFEMNHRRAI